MAPRKPSGPTTPNQDSGDASAPSFEESLERLEAIVEELEGGALSLEDSIARYEEGVRLSRGLTRTLDDAEKRIERLVETSGGEPTTEPMELGADSEGNAREAPPAKRHEPAVPAAEEDELPF